MMPGPLQFADASTYRQFADAAMAILAEFWWVPVLVILIWYLRWYGKANRTEGVTGAAGKAVGLTLKDMGRVGRLGVAFLLGIGAVLLGWAAFVFNVGPTIFAGIAAGDPIVWSTVASMVTAAGAAFDYQWATMGNVVLAFFGTMAIIIGLDKLGDMSAAAADEADDAMEDDD